MGTHCHPEIVRWNDRYNGQRETTQKGGGKRTKRVVLGFQLLPMCELIFETRDISFATLANRVSHDSLPWKMEGSVSGPADRLATSCNCRNPDGGSTAREEADRP